MSIGLKGFQRGHKNLGRNGQHPMFGKKHRKESKIKMSEAHKGKKPSEETRKKMSKAQKLRFKKFGFINSPEAREKISKALTGIKRSDNHKRKISLANKGKIINEKNGMWKGDRAGYSAIHDWVRRRLGKAKFCSNCGKIGELKRGRWTIEWANIDHKYKRSLECFIPLCVDCHKNYDKKFKK